MSRVRVYPAVARIARVSRSRFVTRSRVCGPRRRGPLPHGARAGADLGGAGSPRGCAARGRGGCGRGGNRRGLGFGFADGGGFAAQHREHLGELLGGDEDLAGLGSFGGSDDVAGFEEVHEASGAGEADAQLALEHGGGAKLGGDDKLGGLEQVFEVGSDIFGDFCFLLVGYDVVAVVRFHLALDVGDDLVDLGFADPGTLNTHGLGGTGGQVEGVALADELFGAGLVEDRARVGQRGGREREARGDVGLDEAGDDVDRGALSGQDQVDAGSARELRDYFGISRKEAAALLACGE